MLAISVWLAIRDAIASLADHRLAPRLDAPATPERVLDAIEELRARAGVELSSPLSLAHPSEGGELSRGE